MTVQYLSYWNEVLRRPDVERTKVPVRYDPFDIGVIYAYVHHRWVECVSTYYGQFRGHSEKELLMATAELREQNRQNHVTAPITAKRLADFLAKIEAHEVVLLQRRVEMRAREDGITTGATWTYSEIGQVNTSRITVTSSPTTFSASPTHHE